jgi:alkaline phosphatase
MPTWRFYIATVKWRNQLLALGCLLGFAGLGILYFQHWVVQKPFGIILFIGEGLSADRLAAARVYLGGADAKLALDSMPRLALLTNYSNDFAAPDRAAAASALATGRKVNNRALSVDAEHRALTSMTSVARARGRANGLITNGRLTDATVAAFFAHAAENENDEDAIASQFAACGDFDLAMGGGVGRLLPQTKGGERQDERDLLLELQRNGFDLVRTRAELEAIPAWRRPKLFGAFSNTDLAFANELEAKKDQPSLADMVRRGIELLQYNAGGYLLIVDAALMRKAAESNAAERTLLETLELDRAVATARRYAGPKAMILVCGDAGIGGLSLNGSPFRKDSSIAMLGLNSAGQPWLTWATGPNGIRTYGNPPGGVNPPNSPTAESSTQYLEPAAVYTKNALNTVSDVVAFGSGPGADGVQGVLDNTAIFKIVEDQL